MSEFNDSPSGTFDVFCWNHGYTVYCGCPPACYPDLSGWPGRMYRSISDLEPFHQEVTA